jgi:hypothetical protein
MRLFGRLGVGRRAAVGLVAVATLVVASPAWSADVPNSGFLPDYSGLTPAKSAAGNKLERWLSPKLTRENYHSMIVEDVVFYPTPEATEQVPQQTLDDILAYLSHSVREVVLKEVPQVTEPGPGVARLRVAVTAVAVGSTGMKPYEFVPTAMRAAGQRSQDVTLSVEAILTDSVSGEPLGMVVRHGPGQQLKNARTPLTLDQLKERIDHWAEAAAATVDKRLKRKSAAP